MLSFTQENYERTVTSFLHENLRGLRRSMGSVKFEKQLIKQMKRTGTLAMSRLANKLALKGKCNLVQVGGLTTKRME